MSLSLIQGYSSAEEEEEDRQHSSSYRSDDGDDDEDEAVEGEDGGLISPRNPPNGDKRFHYRPPKPSSSNSTLPSALDAFAEVAGPPEFLNNAVAVPEDTRESMGVLNRRSRNRASREKKDLPAGAVVEAKPQLVGIRDHVRSDVEGSIPSSGSTNQVNGDGKRLITAANPDAKDAADLLRMCLQCGIPKAYSHTRGMVCPVCSDRPLADPMKDAEKKKGSTIKDKEKSKRMKGQSTHASWKSETEMQLRQQYD